MGIQGGQDKSETRQLTGEERAATFNSGIAAIDNARNNMNVPQYMRPQYTDPGAYQGADYTHAAAYVDPGAAKQMADGDYSRLERNMLASQTAGLDRQKSLDAIRTDAGLAKRGIWSSGLAERAQGDNNERYAASYLKAGADAATARYGMEQADLGNLNNYNLNNAAGRNAWNTTDAAGANAWGQAQNSALNAWNMTNATNKNAFETDQAYKQYQAAWQPISSLGAIWNNTAGTKQTSDGWKAGIQMGSGGY